MDRRLGNLLIGGAMLGTALTSTYAQAEESQLCRDVSGKPVDYLAVQADSHALLFARLTLPTPGYKVEFVPTASTGSTPSYRLKCTPPSGIVLQVLTQYKTMIPVRGNHLDQEILVLDADARHPVSVWAQLPRQPH